MEDKIFKFLQIDATFYLQTCLKADMQYANKKCEKTNIIGTEGVRVNLMTFQLRS